MTTHPWRSSGLPVLAGWMVVLFLATLSRVERIREIVLADGVHPVGGDAAYHMRRAMLSIDAPVPTFDPLMNWPEGGICHWSPGFDWLAAATTHLWPGLAPEIALALFPVLCGLLVVCASMGLVHAWMPARPGAAIVAGGIAALCPQQVAIAQFGRLDHHVAEALTGLAVLACVTIPPCKRGWLPIAAWALTAGVGVWVFSGSVLYVGVGVAALIVDALLSGRIDWGRVDAGPSALHASVGLGVATLATEVWVRPLVAEHGESFSFIFPSHLHVALLGVGAAASGFAFLAGARRTVLGRMTAFLVCLGVMGAAVPLVAPSVAAEVQRGVVDFLFRKDPWLSSIDEFQSPFAGTALVDWPARWSGLGGWFSLAALLLAPVAVLLPWRARPRLALRAAAFVVPLIVLGCEQTRFLRVALPPLLCVAAVGLDGVAARLRAPAWLAPVVAIGLSLIFDRTPSSLVLRPARAAEPVEEVSRQLATLPSLPRAEGVLTAWDLGHLVLWHAGRPVVTTGFGSFLDADSFARQQAVWTGSPTDVDRWMRERQLGWVLAGAINLMHLRAGTDHPRPFTRDGYGVGILDSAWFASLPLGPLVIGGSGLPASDVHQLETLWPRVASTRIVGGLSFPVPSAWLYEHVLGARLVGRATPGSRVLLTALLKGGDHTYQWDAWAVADASGAYELVIPVPTAVAGPLATPPSHMLTVDGVRQTVEVPERSVREGARILVPAATPVAPEATLVGPAALAPK